MSFQESKIYDVQKKNKRVESQGNKKYGVQKQSVERPGSLYQKTM